MFEELIRGWDGEFVATRFDAESSTWMFVGIHSTALGPGFGGTRMKVYATPDQALGDVLRLSAAMTFKNAMADLPFGGGKSVLAVSTIPQGEARADMLLRYADLVASLGGGYVTACDMNTTESDMDVVGERCPHVMGRSAAAGGSGTSAPDTAIGVFRGIRASLAHAFGSDDPSGRTIVVEGTGAVGGPLCDLLADAGAKLVVSDIDAERARTVAERVGADIVDPEDAFDTPCDLFSPCATGAVLNADTIPRLRCRVVAGAANNQLAAPVDADRLSAAGILYAPDYVVNAGGVLHLAGYERLGWTPEQMAARLAGIGDTLARVFAAADLDGVTPEAAADRMASERIAAARETR
ncbi:MAG: Glu/Leu/Phe/Val dehydrogenase dimerization domain-containing protein [Actinomycetota bacterium]